MSANQAGEKINVSGTSRPDTDVMSALLAQNWWAVGLRGLAGVVFGLIALLMPGITMLALVLLFSAYMLVDGSFAIVSAVRAARKGERWGLLVAEGVVDILFGAAAFLWPAITILVFVVLVAAWAIISGALMLGAAFRLDIDYGRWWLVVGGVASIVYGVLLIIAPPVGALVLTWWMGAYAIVFGVILMVLAYRLRSRRMDRVQPAAA